MLQYTRWFSKYVKPIPQQNISTGNPESYLVKFLAIMK